ncbi:MAG: VOC family protein, partial [Comamonadaceae bacterium]
PTSMMLAHNVASAAQVDSVMATAEAAGAHVLKPARATDWGGYAGYFQDPDQHAWEVAFNPQWEVPSD